MVGRPVVGRKCQSVPVPVCPSCRTGTDLGVEPGTVWRSCTRKDGVRSGSSGHSGDFLSREDGRPGKGSNGDKVLDKKGKPRGRMGRNGDRVLGRLVSPGRVGWSV